MKIAYLITAYKDPVQLMMLIKALGNQTFFIHIDKKYNDSEFKSQLSGFHSVYWIEDRIRISWGGYSQVQSIIMLLKACLSSGFVYDRVVCISGTDYPVWSNPKIEAEFSENPHKQYLTGFNISECVSAEQIERIEKYYFFDIKSKLLRDITNRFSSILYHLHIARKRRVYRTRTHTWTIYCGSDYWALTYECACYLYKQCISQNGLMRYISTSFVPSEIFVQTILLNSPFKDQIAIYPDKLYKNLASLTPLQYIDYRPTGMEVLDETSFNAIISSNKMFFRKASSTKSFDLINLIDAYREKI